MSSSSSFCRSFQPLGCAWFASILAQVVSAGSLLSCPSLLVAAMSPKATTLTHEQCKQLIKDHVAELNDNHFLTADPDQVTLVIGDLLQRRRVECLAKEIGLLIRRLLSKQKCDLLIRRNLRAEQLKGGQALREFFGRGCSGDASHQRQHGFTSCF